MTRKLSIAALIASLAAGSALGGVARAADAPSAGFYGGIALRDGGAQQGVAIGNAGNLQRFGSPLGDVWASQALVFGGYRWRNELSLEAALGSGAGYRLPGRGGVGLMLPQGYDQGARAWNLDVIGNWGFWRSFSLYGRLGYAQSDMAPQYGTSIASPIDRRPRDGLSYGLGLRYDINRSLGLKLEYARIASQSDASSFALPDADQVQFGLNFRF